MVLKMRSIASRTHFVLRAIAACTALLISSACMSGTSDNDVQRERLAGRDFDIPKRYFQSERGTPSWLRWLPGLDDGSRDLLLTIAASEVAAAVPGFKPKDGGYNDDLRLRLVVLKEEEKGRYTDPNRFAEIWNNTGSYRDRIIEADHGTDLVRIYRRIEYPDSWEMFTISPDGKVMPRDLFYFWIGHCLNSHSPLTPSGSLALCKSYVIVGDVAVNFTMSAQNITNTKRIRNYLKELVSQWLKR